jgi:hypothetical protein
LGTGRAGGLSESPAVRREVREYEPVKRSLFKTTFLRNIGKRLPDYRVLHHTVTVVMLCFLDPMKALTFCLQPAARTTQLIRHISEPLILCFKYVSQSTISETTAAANTELSLEHTDRNRQGEVNSVLLKNKKHIGKELAAPKNGTMKTYVYKGCESKARLLTKPGAKCATAVIFTLRPLWPRERGAYTHRLGS